jgi:hypothetical protein
VPPGEILREPGHAGPHRQPFQLMVPRWPDLAKNKSGSTRR